MGAMRAEVAAKSAAADVSVTLKEEENMQKNILEKSVLHALDAAEQAKLAAEKINEAICNPTFDTTLIESATKEAYVSSTNAILSLDEAKDALNKLPSQSRGEFTELIMKTCTAIEEAK